MDQHGARDGAPAVRVTEARTVAAASPMVKRPVWAEHSSPPLFVGRLSEFWVEQRFQHCIDATPFPLGFSAPWKSGSLEPRLRFAREFAGLSPPARRP